MRSPRRRRWALAILAFALAATAQAFGNANATEAQFYSGTCGVYPGGSMCFCLGPSGGDCDYNSDCPMTCGPF